MQQAYAVTGTIANGQLIHLEKPLPISAKRVSVIVRPASQRERNGKTLVDWLERIHRRKRESGVRFLTKEEIDRWIREERDSWGD